MSDWRPIETAPKDGTIIRLFHPNWAMDGWPNDFTGRWDRFACEWRADPALMLTIGDGPEIEDPTYWKPRSHIKIGRDDG